MQAIFTAVDPTKDQKPRSIASRRARQHKSFSEIPAKTR
jgi:hypothetical protein